MTKFWISPTLGFYSGDNTEGAREATQEEIDNHFNPKKSLEETKAAKWQEIKAIRDEKENAGFPYMGGKTLDSDNRAVQRISIAVQAAQTAIAAGKPFNLEWTCTDNSVIAMTAGEVIGMSVALANHTNTLHEKARLLRQQIDSATTAEGVEAVEW